MIADCTLAAEQRRLLDGIARTLASCTKSGWQLMVFATDFGLRPSPGTMFVYRNGVETTEPAPRELSGELKRLRDSFDTGPPLRSLNLLVHEDGADPSFGFSNPTGSDQQPGFDLWFGTGGIVPRLLHRLNGGTPGIVRPADGGLEYLPEPESGPPLARFSSLADAARYQLRIAADHRLEQLGLPALHELSGRRLPAGAGLSYQPGPLAWRLDRHGENHGSAQFASAEDALLFMSTAFVQPAGIVERALAAAAMATAGAAILAHTPTGDRTPRAPVDQQQPQLGPLQLGPLLERLQVRAGSWSAGTVTVTDVAGHEHTVLWPAVPASGPRDAEPQRAGVASLVMAAGESYRAWHHLQPGTPAMPLEEQDPAALTDGICAAKGNEQYRLEPDSSDLLPVELIRPAIGGRTTVERTMVAAGLPVGLAVQRLGPPIVFPDGFGEWLVDSAGYEAWQLRSTPAAVTAQPVLPFVSDAPTSAVGALRDKDGVARLRYRGTKVDQLRPDWGLQGKTGYVNADLREAAQLHRREGTAASYVNLLRQLRGGWVWQDGSPSTLDRGHGGSLEFRYYDVPGYGLTIAVYTGADELERHFRTEQRALGDRDAWLHPATIAARSRQGRLTDGRWQDCRWIQVDPAGPGCMVDAADIASAEEGYEAVEIKTALSGGGTGSATDQLLFEALCLAPDPRGDHGETYLWLAFEAEAQAPLTAVADPGQLLVFTSRLEIAAAAPSLRPECRPAAWFWQHILACPDITSVRFNPAGPTAVVRRPEMLRYLGEQAD